MGRMPIFSLFIVYLVQSAKSRAIEDELTENDIKLPSGYSSWERMIQDREIAQAGLSSLFTTPINGHQWSNGEVPYEISDEYTNEEKNIIRSVMEEFHQKSCIRFVETSIWKFWQNRVWISPNQGRRTCQSHLGRRRKGMFYQDLDLGQDCLLSRGIIIHELLHLLGFIHEHNRSIRDDYIYVLFQNIKPAFGDNFVKMPNEFSTHDQSPYDYGSVLHYGAQSGSKSGEPTIVPKNRLPSGVQLGQRDGFSDYDLKRLNRYYACQN